VPTVLLADARQFLTRECNDRLSLGHRGIAEVVFEAGPGEHERDRERFVAGISDRDPHVPGDVDGRARADRSLPIADLRNAGAVADEDDLVCQQVSVGRYGLAGRNVLVPHDEVGRPAIPVVDLDDERRATQQTAHAALPLFGSEDERRGSG
jgi:hypothetical protein